MSFLEEEKIEKMSRILFKLLPAELSDLDDRLQALENRISELVWELDELRDRVERLERGGGHP